MYIPCQVAPARQEVRGEAVGGEPFEWGQMQHSPCEDTAQSIKCHSTGISLPVAAQACSPPARSCTPCIPPAASACAARCESLPFRHITTTWVSLPSSARLTLISPIRSATCTTAMLLVGPALDELWGEGLRRSRCQAHNSRCHATAQRAASARHTSVAGTLMAPRRWPHAKSSGARTSSRRSDEPLRNKALSSAHSRRCAGGSSCSTSAAPSTSCCPPANRQCRVGRSGESNLARAHKLERTRLYRRGERRSQSCLTLFLLQSWGQLPQIGKLQTIQCKARARSSAKLEWARL